MQTDTLTAFKLHALKVEERAAEAAQPLTDIQETAKDLYRRGFNVFPLPEAYEWRANAEGGKPDKHPFGRTGKLFYTRLHFCGDGECHHVKQGAIFSSLFRRANIGVMAGQTSGNLLIVDCDSGTAFENVGYNMVKNNIPFWSFKSHRGGAYLVRVIEGEVKNVPAKNSTIKDVELWGRAHFAVLPPSIHPSGDAYRWNTPEPRTSLLSPTESIPPVSITALEWLGAKLYKGNERGNDDLDVPSELRCLSHKNQLAWMEGGREGARNLTAFDIACDLAGNGFTKQQAESVMREFAERCTPALSSKELSARIESAYKKDRDAARAHFGTVQARQSVYEWEQAQEFVGAYNWPAQFGKRASVVRSVFLACIERAKMSHSGIWRASERELSEAVQRDRKTVRRAKLDLLAAGLLVLPETDRFVTGGASLFRFGGNVITSPSITTCTTTGGNNDGPKLPKTDAERDVFGAMWGCAYDVYSHLLTQPERTKAAIARSTNNNAGSVRIALEQLRAARLVTFSEAEGVYYGEPVTDATLRELACTLTKRGKVASGRSQARREKHAAEREINASEDMARAIERYRKGHRPTRKASKKQDLAAQVAEMVTQAASEEGNTLTVEPLELARSIIAKAEQWAVENDPLERATGRVEKMLSYYKDGELESMPRPQRLAVARQIIDICKQEYGLKNIPQKGNL